MERLTFPKVNRNTTRQRENRERLYRIASSYLLSQFTIASFFGFEWRLSQTWECIEIRKYVHDLCGWWRYDDRHISPVKSRDLFILFPCQSFSFCCSCSFFGSLHSLSHFFSIKSYGTLGISFDITIVICTPPLSLHACIVGNTKYHRHHHPHYHVHFFWYFLVFSLSSDGGVNYHTAAATQSCCACCLAFIPLLLTFSSQKLQRIRIG